MHFSETSLSGAKLVDLDRIEDDRGFFSRIFCRQEFNHAGLKEDVAQANLSFNRHKGTVRGMHYQVEPALETKFVRCIRGAVLDVIVDVRKGSPTYLHHFDVELTAENRQAIYIPANFAHGFQTLEDNSEVMYMVSGFYAAEHERGLRYNDPALSIAWPLPVSHVSSKDTTWPLLSTHN